MDEALKNKVADGIVRELIPTLSTISDAIATKLEAIRCPEMDMQSVTDLVTTRLIHAIAIMSEGNEANEAVTVANKRGNTLCYNYV